MTPQELRNSILQRAMEGKLVEQRPEEGEVKSILELYNLGTLKRKDDYYEIPKQWEWFSLSSLCDLIGGYAFKSTEYLSEGIRVIRISDFNEDGLLNKDKKYYKENKSLNGYLIKPYDILMCMTGGTVGKTAFLRIVDENLYLNQRVAIIRNKNQMILNTEYLNYVITSKFIKNIINEEKNSTNDNISMKLIKDFPIPLPSIKEQNRIVEKIEELLPLVDEYEKNWQKLEDLNKKFPEDMKKSLLQEAIKGKLVEQRPEEGTGEDLYKHIQEEKNKLIQEGKIKKQKALPEIKEDEIPFEIPVSWKWVRLHEIVYNHGQEKPKVKFSYIDIGSVDNKKNKLNLNENILDYEDAPSRARKIVKKGDIIYSTVRPYLHNICIIDRTFLHKPIASTGFAVLSCYNGVYNKFLFYYLLSPIFDEYVNNNENSKGVAYPAINDRQLYKGLIPLPPLQEQERIVEKLEELLPLCDQLVQKQ